jgi:2'-5' RNA ligase
MDGQLFLSMRLFTGISIASATLENLAELLAELHPLAPVKWSPVENLHITTRFIGEWPETRLAELEQTLGRIEPVGAIDIRIAALDYYPNAGRPRVLFAGVSAGVPLIRLAESIDEALGAVGIKREDRAYSPHLTLARIRNENIHKLRERITNMPNIEFGSFEVTEFHLYLSKTSPHRSFYSKLRTYTTC